MKKRKAWKWLMIALAAMAAIMGAIVWDAHRRADRIFREHDLDVTTRIAAIRARPKVSRPPLFGEAIPGNGWSALEKALDAFKAIPYADAEKVLESCGLLPEEIKDEASLDAIFTNYAPAFDQLREVLRYERLDAAHAYESGFPMSVDYGIYAITASKFLAGLGTHRHRAGQDALALEPLNQALVLAHDVGRNGPVVTFLVQVVCEGIAEDAWRTVLDGHELSADRLRKATEAMDLLWKFRPSCVDSIEVEDVMLRRAVADLALGALVLDPLGFWGGRSWRYLFSRRLCYAGALPICKQYFADLREVGKLSCWEREAATLRVRNHASIDRNQIARMALPNTGKIFRRDAIAQMGWTLMRVATALAWYEAEKGAPPASLRDLVPRYLSAVPDCPLTGKPLGYAPGKVWSYGVDGVDNGGMPNPKGDEEPGGDVVWVVTRKK